MDPRKLTLGLSFSRSVTVGADRVEHFALATDDSNPIHFDERAALDANFGGVIAHGDLVVPMANIIVVEDLPGIMVMERTNTKFQRAILVGQQIRIDATIRSVEKGTSRGPAYLELIIDMRFLSPVGKICISSTALARLYVANEIADHFPSHAEA